MQSDRSPAAALDCPLNFWTERDISVVDSGRLELYVNSRLMCVARKILLSIISYGLGAEDDRVNSDISSVCVMSLGVCI